jgi:hypothetical protein
MNKLDGLTPHVKQLSCRVRVLLASMTEQDVAVLTAAINNAELWPARALSNSLKERGVSVTDLTITKHRKGFCSC